jgi:hypothetical protein
MKFNINIDEKYRILEMHSKERNFLLKEQTDNLKQKLDQISDNYITGGTVVGISGFSDPNLKMAIKKESKKNPGTFRYFFVDGRVGDIIDGKIVIINEKWNVEDYLRKIPEKQLNLQREVNWFTKQELINKGIPVDQIDNVNMYQRKEQNGIILYREIQDKGTPSKFSQRQKDIIKSFEASGYYPCNEFEIGLQLQRYELHKDPKYTGIFDVPVELCKSNVSGGKPPKYHKKDTSDTSNTGETDQNSSVEPAPEGLKNTEELEDPNYLKELTAQKLNKNKCREHLSNYYTFWRNNLEISDQSFVNLKGITQACINNFDFRGGMFRKTDDYVKVMTGMRASNGIGPGPGKDSNGRVWRLTPRRKIK